MAIPDLKPWWATFIEKVGIIAALTIFLVWFVVWDLRQRVTNLEKVTAQTLEIMTNAGNTMHEYAKEAQRERADRDRLLHQICVNTSKPGVVGLCGS